MRIKNFEKKEYKVKLYNNQMSGCPICGPHSGCNSGWNRTKNWKSYRKTQYKS